MNNIVQNSSADYLAENNISSSAEDELVLKGIPSSPGMAFGKAYVIYPEKIIVHDTPISTDQIPQELKRLDSSVKDLVNEFRATLKKVRKESQNVKAVLETNIVILQDEFLLNAIREKIQQGYSAESSVSKELDNQIHYLRQAKDLILKERAVDLENIKIRILSMLRDRDVSFAIEKDSVIIAKSLSPTDLIILKEIGVLAIITEVGGISAHSSILARSFEIPEVIGVKDATKLIDPGDDIIVDGHIGEIIIEPEPKSVSLFKIKKARENEHKKKLGDLIKLPAETKDGKYVRLLANVDFPEDVEQAALVGADGIGLVRSENLILLLGKFPSEEEQFTWYTQMAQRAYPNDVTIRAFDVGSDKHAEGMPRHENNPALGFRGIRFLLSRNDIFKSQVKAILRASTHKNVKLMLPMISNIGEVTKSLEIIDECKKILDEEGHDYYAKMPVGVMIETPAAALIADQLSKIVDFFSIGTNDLTQYTLAADRTNDFVADFYYPFHPGVLRLIKMTIDTARKNKITVSICGELAGHAAATSLLIGMGIDELSVNPSILLELKNRVRESDYTDSTVLADDVMNCSNYDDIRNRLIGKKS